MSRSSRPLSPHLQVYRLPLTGLISITHRMTGVFLSLALLLVLALLLTIASGESAYATMQQWLSFWFCRLVYWGIVFSLYFHMCHGIRHLLWDVGNGFNKNALQRLALIELAFTVLLTGGSWILSWGA